MKTCHLFAVCFFLLMAVGCTKEHEENDSEDQAEKPHSTHSVLTDAVKGPIDKAKAAASQVEQSDEETEDQSSEEEE